MLAGDSITTSTDMRGDIHAGTVGRGSRLTCATVPLMGRVGGYWSIRWSTEGLGGPIGASRPGKIVSKHYDAV